MIKAFNEKHDREFGVPPEEMVLPIPKWMVPIPPGFKEAEDKPARDRLVVDYHITLNQGPANG